MCVWQGALTSSFRSGILAREDHAVSYRTRRKHSNHRADSCFIQPAIEAAENIELRAVYSRTAQSAQSIATAVSSQVELYSDDSERAFEELLNGDDIQAVVLS